MIEFGWGSVGWKFGFSRDQWLDFGGQLSCIDEVGNEIYCDMVSGLMILCAWAVQLF